MKFLYPQFLYALAALAIPIIIHLFNFRKFKTVYFSNVRFLKEVKKQTKAQSKLKHLLVLLSRLLTITALVLAFAQPYIAENNKTIADKQTISVYVDNSFSMDTENENGRLLLTAKQKAEAIVQAYQNTDEFQIITNNLSGKHQILLSKELFLDELFEIESSSQSTAISKLVDRQSHTLNNSNTEEKTLYLISDFQSSNTDLESFEIDTNINIRLIPTTPHTVNNLYIDSCWISTPNPQLGQNITLNAKLINKGERRENIPVQLKVNGQQKAIATTDILDEAVVELHFVCQQNGWQEATVSISDHPVSFDDDFYCAFEIKKQLFIQSIYETSTHPSLEKLFGSDDYCQYSTQNIQQLKHSELFEQQLLILDGLTYIASGLSQTLQQFVAEGGSLLIFPSEKSDLTSYKKLLQSLDTDYFISLDESAINIIQLHEEHRLFEGVFEEVNKKLDFPKIEQYFTQTQLSKTTNAPIISLENRQALISEYQYQKGKIYLSSIGLESEFGSFSQHALFVPILYNIASHSRGTQSLFHQIGNTHIPSDLLLSKELVYELKGQGVSFIPQVQNSQIGVYNQITTAGHYQLTQQEEKIANIAFNYSRKESNTSVLSTEELEAFASQYTNIEVIHAKESTLTQTLNILNKGTALWKLCLIFALGFLALEILIIKRL